MKCDFDTIIIGSGVVGISIGLEFAKKGEDVLIIEKIHHLERKHQVEIQK